MYQAFPSIPGSIQPYDGAVMTCGSAVESVGPNDSSGQTTALGLGGDAKMDALAGAATFDAVKLTITFTTDASVDGVSFNLLFGSEEFPEYVGAFNDAFACFLDGENITFDADGNAVTVNNNYFVVSDCQTMYNLPGFSGQGYTGLTQGTACGSPNGSTTEAGATGWLTTTAPVTPGETIKLKFSIWDEGDGIYDSVVFIDNFQWHGAPQTDPDTG